MGAEVADIVRVSNSVGVPLSTPVEVSKDKPLGSDGLMAHDTISPEPVMVGEGGRWFEVVLLGKPQTFSRNELVGDSATYVRQM